MLLFTAIVRESAASLLYSHTYNTFFRLCQQYNSNRYDMIVIGGSVNRGSAVMCRIVEFMARAGIRVRTRVLYDWDTHLVKQFRLALLRYVSKFTTSHITLLRWCYVWVIRDEIGETEENGTSSIALLK